MADAPESALATAAAFNSTDSVTGIQGGENKNFPATLPNFLQLVGNDNLFAGPNCGNRTLVGQGNSGYGPYSLNSLTSGSFNWGSGNGALRYLRRGSQNTADGPDALANLIDGSYNFGLGYAAGIAYTTNESSNIVILHSGVTGESHVIRLGTPGSSTGQQTDTHLAGNVHVTQLDEITTYNVTNKEFCKRGIKDFSAFSWSNILTITPSTVTGLYIAGYVEVKVSANTLTVGPGVRVSKWSFIYANGTPTVAVMGTDVATANAPQFQLVVSGNNVVLQAQSQDGSHAAQGSVKYEIIVPKEGGSTPSGATFTVT